MRFPLSALLHGTVGGKALHSALGAVLRALFLEHGVNAGILVFVLDLAAPIALALVDVPGRVPGSIALTAATPQREIARGRRARVEMLVVIGARRDEQAVRFPGELLEFRLALRPDETEAGAAQDQEQCTAPDVL